MNKRESFRDLVRIIVSTFKKDAEKGMIHMKILMQLREPLFQRGTEGNKGEEAINTIKDEAESTRKE